MRKLDFTHRSQQREILDDHTPEQAAVDRIYRFLARVGRHLGGVRATMARFEVFSRGWAPGETIRVLDVACGGGDMARALIAWGRRKGFDVRVVGLDVSHAALDYARRASSFDGRLQLLCADITRPVVAEGTFDYVTTALFFHHRPDAELVDLLERFDRIARRGIVVNDLVRSRAAWWWTWLLTRPFHPILNHDGPLSVRRAFRPSDLAALAKEARLPWLAVRRHAGYRLTLSGEKPDWGRPDEARGRRGARS